MSDTALRGAYDGPTSQEEQAHKRLIETVAGRQINEINEALMQIDDLLHEGFRAKLAPVLELNPDSSEKGLLPREVTNTVLNRMLDDTVGRANGTLKRVQDLLDEIIM